VELRPVYHRKEERIRAHVLLCWLALMLIRIAENQTGQTWREIRSLMQTLHLVEYRLDAGKLRQRTELTDEHRAIVTALQIAEPQQIWGISLS
jgi:transposase